jgi:hypothetical protein
MTFNINNQTGGVINQVAGDQHIAGGQHGTLTVTETARAAVAALSHGVREADLDADARAQAESHLDEIGTEMRKPSPEPPLVARAVEALTSLLKRAGALASAGASLVTPLQMIASWLGSLGVPILNLLPALA